MEDRHLFTVADETYEYYYDFSDVLKNDASYVYLVVKDMIERYSGL